MNAPGVAVALGCALFATGCMSSSIEDGTQLPEPAEIPVEGTFRHALSGMEFAGELGPFQRTEVVRYDEEGRDVSATYASPLGKFPVIATVYVYPGREVSSFLAYGRTVAEYAQRLAKQDFQHERDGVRNSYESDQNASLVSEEELTLPLGGARRRGWRAEFSVDGAMGVRGIPCTTLLYWFPSVDGKWNVKYLFTFWRGPSSPEKGLQTVLEGAPWPEASR